MNTRRFRVFIVRETERAWQFCDNADNAKVTAQGWVPKSAVVRITKMPIKDQLANRECIADIEEWKARELPFKDV